MSFAIRAFTDADYSMTVGIHNAIYPDYPWTEAEVQRWDAVRNPEHAFGRWVIEGPAARIVGYAYYYQPPTMYAQHHLSFNIKIHPEHQGRGFGAALYQKLAAQFEMLQTSVIRTLVKSSHQRSVQFLLDRQFAEEMRFWESWLDVSAFDPAPCYEAEARLRAAGVEIKTYRELQGEPNLHRRLKDLYNELYRDVPQPEPFTDLTLEEFEHEVLDDLAFLPDALFIAIHNCEYIGMAQLCKKQASRDLLTGLTGTRRGYRRQGVARALKLRTVAYAHAQGYEKIKTSNASTNQPMLAINDELGFVKQPIWIQLARRLRDA